MLRVDYEELEPSDDYLLMQYEGKPFHGVAFECDENDKLVAETNFVDGQKSGVSREWSSSGILIREQWFALNSLHGTSREWYIDGAPKIDGIYELGVCIKEREWDVNGNAVKNYVIDETSPQFRTLEKLRTSNLGHIVTNLHSSHFL